MGIEDYEKDIPDKYRKGTLENQFTIGDFAEQVTTETMQYFLIRLANESSNKGFQELVLTEAAKSSGEDYQKLVSRFEKLIPPKEPDFIDKYNNKHAVLMVGRKCVVLNEGIDPVSGEYTVNFCSPTDFNNFYSNDWVYVQHKETSNRMVKVKLAPKWLESKRRRQYQGVVFEPGRTVDGYYNMWRGLTVIPAKGDWSLMREHIFRIICQGDEKIFLWVMAWLAHQVQKLGDDRPGTCIVLKGEQGTGKGIFAREYGKIFGTHFLHLMSANQIAGRFTGHLANKIFVFCDEVIWDGSKTMSSVLKAIITEPTIAIEYKNVDIFNVRNHISLMIASNGDFIVPAEIGERRFCVLEVSSERANDSEYFNKIMIQMNNGGREAMLYDLQNMNISGINLRSIPRTDALLGQIMKNIPNVGKFWMDYLMMNNVPDGEDEDGCLSIEKDSLYNKYVAYAKKLGLKEIESNISFGRTLKKYCPAVKMNERSTKGDRRMLYKFPSLSECRKQFEKVIGQTGIF